MNADQLSRLVAAVDARTRNRILLAACDEMERRGMLADPEYAELVAKARAQALFLLMPKPGAKHADGKDLLSRALQ